jgi:ELWxxDGT repeat protein
MMKKLLKTSLISLAVLFAMSGCGGGSTTPNPDTNKTDTNTTDTNTSKTNHPPIAKIVASTTVANIYTRIDLDGSQSSDADSDTLSYTWTLVLRPTGSTAQLQNTTGTHSALTAEKAGFYTVRLTVDDGKNTVTSDTNITIRPTSMFRLETASEDNEPWFTNGTAPGTHLITDLNTWTKDAHPGKPIRMGNKIFFSANDYEHGSELWVADSNGAHMVKDIRPGIQNASPSYLTAWQGLLYFAATGADGTTTLWYSDGTADGTQPVTTDHPPHGPSNIIAADDRLFFAATGSDASGQSLGNELWESDGTQSGTRMVADIYAGSVSSYPGYLTYVGATHTLYFAAGTASGHSLYSYDLLSGAAPAIVTGGANIEPKYLHAFGSKVLFSATDNTNGREPWIGDTTGVSIIDNLASVGSDKTINSNPNEFTTKDNQHFYFTAFNGQHRYLYISDGTAAGTQIVDTNVIQPAYLMMVGTELYFDAAFGSNDSVLWHSDGTSGGTDAVDLTAQAPQAHKTYGLTAYHGTLYFWGNYTENGARINSLWSYTPGDVHEKLIRQFAASNTYSGGSLVAGQDGRIYFAIKDKARDKELWHTDGTPAGTHLHYDVNRQTKSSRVNPPAKNLRIGDHLYHLAYSSQADGNIALYKTQLSDGTTTRIRGDNNLSVKAIAKIDNDLYGLEYDRITAHIRLWVIHPGDTSPHILKDNTGVQPVLNGLVAAGDSLYTLVEAGSQKTLSRYRLSSGAFNDIHASNVISNVTAVDGKVFFSALGTGVGVELWRYDPLNNTKQSYDIHPGAGSSNPGDLTALGDWLYFFAEDGSTNLGNDLWRIKYDGSGLAKIYDIDGSTGMIFLDNLRATTNALFWVLNDLTMSDAKLMRYLPDKTVQELTFEDPFSFTGLGNRLYFLYSDAGIRRVGWVNAADSSGTGGVEADEFVGSYGDMPLYTRTQPDGTHTLYYGNGEASDETEVLDRIR